MSSELDPRMSKYERQAMNILSGVHRGAGKPITYRVLAQSLGVAERTARRIVRRLTILYHMPICTSYDADGGGYYWAERPEEIRACADQLEQHAVSILSRAADLRNVSLSKYLGQLQLEFDKKKQ